MTITITITAINAEQAKKEAAIIGGSQAPMIQQQAPAVTSQRSGPALVITGAALESIARELGIGDDDRENPETYGMAITRKLDALRATHDKLALTWSEERVGICGLLGLSSDVDEWAIHSAIKALASKTEPTKRAPGRPRGSGKKSATVEELKVLETLDPGLMDLIGRPPVTRKEGEPEPLVYTVNRDDEPLSITEIDDAIAGAFAFDSAVVTRLASDAAIASFEATKDLMKRDQEHGATTYSRKEWIARIKDAGACFGWTDQDYLYAANAVFGMYGLPKHAITVLSHEFGISGSELGAWMGDADFRNASNPEVMNPTALVCALIRRFGKTSTTDVTADPASLGLVVEAPATSNVTEAF